MPVEQYGGRAVLWDSINYNIRKTELTGSSAIIFQASRTKTIVIMTKYSCPPSHQAW